MEARIQRGVPRQPHPGPTLLQWVSDTFGLPIALLSQPTADVSVTTSSYLEGELTTSPASLTFTTENWDTAQTVTLASAEEEDHLNDWARLTYTASGGGYDDESAGIRALNADNDTEEQTATDINAHRGSVPV